MTAHSSTRSRQQRCSACEVIPLVKALEEDEKIHDPLPMVIFVNLKSLLSISENKYKNGNINTKWQ